MGVLSKSTASFNRLTRASLARERSGNEERLIESTLPAIPP
jgi:hypothetical protein